MKLFCRYLVLFAASSVLFCGSAFAAPSIDGYIGIDEWGSGSYNQTEANGWGINPTPSERGNLHVENAKDDGDWKYDAEKLGLIVEDNWLYISLQADYDFTKNNQTQKPGDFIFQFTDVEGNSAITAASTLALDFSFDNSDNLDGLTFHWGNLTFADSYPHQQGLAYSVASSDSSDNSFEYKYDFEYITGGDALYNGYSLELAINLADVDLDSTIRNLFANSGYAQMHWQMACGNDVLYVADSYPTNTGGTVPEPATFFLLGIGLLGAGFLERRRQDLQKNS